MRIAYEIIKSIVYVSARCQQFVSWEPVNFPMPFVLMAMVRRPRPANVIVGTYEWVHLESERVIVSIFVIFFGYSCFVPWIDYATQLHPAIWFKGLAVNKISSCAVNPGKERILFGLFGPRSVPIEIIERSLFVLQHKGDAPRRLNKSSESVPKRLWFMVVVSHLMPPVVYLVQSVMCVGYRAGGSSLGRQALG